MVFASIACAGSGAGAGEAHRLEVQRLDEGTEKDRIEIRGAAAGAFDPEIWQAGTLHLLPDARQPLIEPRPGAFRNIYAPSPVQTPDGWRVFYGGWDGVPTGNDRIYSLHTGDFLTFGDHQTVIEHGVFQHVCNVNAMRLDDGAYRLICTAYPDEHGLNKPAGFTSPDGRRWNGAPAPYPARMSDIITMRGYDGYPSADINGMNVLLREGEQYRLYFCNFKDFGKVFAAHSRDGKQFDFDGVALEQKAAVNDVKKMIVNKQAWYLMGLHMNTDRLWYSVSRDPLHFPASHELARNVGEKDRYIVAIGWVMDGAHDSPGRRVLGFLYGAGAVSSLDRNRIFARWLQKKVTFVSAGGQRISGSEAFGPDRQIIRLDQVDKPLRGHFALFGEDGKSLLSRSEVLTVEPGSIFKLATK
jgi:hypothetical protein